jgi:hypothetical protein
MIFKFIRSMFSIRSAATVGVNEITSAMRSEIGLLIRADSFNESNRTFEATASTDNPVAMFDMERWEIVDEILTADGGTFPAEIPMLDSHDRSSVFKVLGNGTDARNSNGSWTIKLTFDDDPDSDRAMKKVAKRFIRDVSIGYTVESCVYIEAGQTESINGKEYTAGQRRLKVCTKWHANEISLTPIGADRDAKIRAAIALRESAPRQTRHDELAAELDDLIIDTGLPRDEVVNDMATAAGVSTSVVNEILEGNVAPEAEQLDGFAAVLETETESLAQLV